MQLSENGLNFIASFEGYHRKLPNGDCTTYYCPAHVLTIGYGCTEGITEGMVWTKEQAMAAFRKELAKHEAAVTRLTTVELNQNQYDALVSFSYNCGSGALGSSTLLKKVNAADWEGAAKQFGNWVRGGGRVLPGLVRRRADEASMFRRPVAPSVEPDMPQRVDQLPSPKEAHLEAHAALSEASTGYSLVGRGIQAMRWLGPSGALGMAGKKAIEGGSADATNVTPVATDLLGQVGAAAHLVAQYGLPFLGIALVAVLLLEGIRYLQRSYVVEAKP